jgi:exopolysaccharide production protein ExoQ
MKTGALGGGLPPFTSTLGRPSVSTRMIDKFAIVPISACVFALIVAPLLLFVTPPDQALEARPENRLFWPVMAVISVVLALQNRARLGRLTLPPHIICLLAYLAFAGASVLWAFKPESAFIRFVQQVMIVTSIVLPAMLAARTADMMRGLFLCFAFASILNVFFVLGGTATIVSNGLVLAYLGSPGYFVFKNYLGECAAIAFLLSLHEILYPGWRRPLGIIVAVIATFLIFSSDSKTALGLAFISPFLAGLTLITRKMTRISPAIILLSIPFCYAVLSSVSNFNSNYVSYMLYGDSSFTGRTVIWDFAQHEIERRPLLGWGYLSFWLVGPDAPSIVEAPGWVKTMPNAHNGYYDTMLEMGYLGLGFLVLFIIATLHSVGRVADRDPRRAWLVLSLALFIIIYNYMETLWMHGFEFLWVVFVIVAAEIGRFWRPFPLTRAAYGSRSPRPGCLGPSPGARRPRVRIRLS